MKCLLTSILIGVSFLGHSQLLENAINSLNNQDIQKAKNELLDLSNTDPRDAEAKFWLGVALYKEFLDPQLNANNDIKPLVDAGIFFEKAYFLNANFSSDEKVKHIKTFQDVAFNEGVNDFQRSELEMAFTLFKMSSQCASWRKVKDNQSYYYAGHCANKLSEFHWALQYLEPLVNSDPKNEKYSKELFTSYKGLNQYEKAANLISQALLYNQSSEYFWNESMVLNMKSENVNEAIKAAKQLCLLDGNNSNNTALLASLYDQVGDEKAAVEAYKEAVDQNPENVQATFNLGVMIYNQVIANNKSAPTKEKTEKSKILLQEAEKYLLKALSLDSNNEDVFILLENIASMK